MSLRLAEYGMNKSFKNFLSISNKIEISLVGQAPDFVAQHTLEICQYKNFVARRIEHDLLYWISHSDHMQVTVKSQ